MSIPSSHPPVIGRLIQIMVREIAVFLRLISDRRVSLLLKLIPAAGVMYAIVPDSFPGPLDDLVVLAFCLLLFVVLCPKKLADEIRLGLDRVATGPRQRLTPEDSLDRSDPIEDRQDKKM